MKNFLILLILLMSFVACDNGGSDSENSTGETVDKPSPPTPGTEIKWGELRCQQSASCENPILNLEHSQIVDLFTGFFSKAKQNLPKNSFPGFECGQTFLSRWTSEFVTFNSMNEMQFKELQNFTLKIINTKECSAKNNLNENLNKYFKQTKEYKNETQ